MLLGGRQTLSRLAPRSGPRRFCCRTFFFSGSAACRWAHPVPQNAETGTKIVMRQPDASKQQHARVQRHMAGVLTLAFVMASGVVISRYSSEKPKFIEQLSALEDEVERQRRRIRAEDLQSLLGFGLEEVRGSREDDPDMAVEEQLVVQAERLARVFQELFPEEAPDLGRDFPEELVACVAAELPRLQALPRTAALRQAYLVQDAFIAQRFPSTITKTRGAAALP